ncbi:hypothetical protein [Bradyrhizobium canariense]|uniref:MAC/Perforin domain-containing protein n=1 Tax=Bradyrhizobium canariense TaxID=255045 RepID=A0A1X3GX38_9BRAD|nr:hypothetical protein [Bradyrhizobium canariense]OSI70482.1 hypothetical protein BSZ22_14780 [Bradyrhizobium canariense]OSI75315.1 hypothetical protein BSZ23_29370 [Bradyrhizobium canariense]OSI85844.1 hypothetical protein BSZ25_31590 [Bradyrhizobium canariense]OSI88223.1 hypothetical protein BSZ24_24950 [Bradyrhizobium canariense]OSI99048.1 hypothetical protein BSZ16_30800 [Bradyrhizobium canariense]
MLKMVKVSFWLMLFLLCAENNSFALDYYNLTRPTHRVPLSGDIGANVVLGLGLNLNEPDDPIPAPRGPFMGKELAADFKAVPAHKQAPEQPINKDEIFNSTTSFIEDQSDYEFSHSLRANMKASFSFASGSAAYDYVKTVRRTSDVILALITENTTSPIIPSDRLIWANEPSSEQIADKDERLLQFIADYGSHYVETVRYGFKIAIYGRRATTSESERREFRAAFKAAFGGGAAGGKIDDVTRTRLTMSTVELRAEVTSGGLEPKGATIFTRFDDIAEFLSRLRDEQVKLFPGPIEVTGRSYWHTLLQYPNSREVLAETPARIEAPYGVPRGAVVAWNPPPEAMKRNGDVSVDLTVPEGWAICDGSNGTPDLRNRFVMGTEPLQIGLTGGSETHDHIANSKIVYENGEFPVGGGPGNTIRVYSTVLPSRALPPFYRLVYIMRL